MLLLLLQEQRVTELPSIAHATTGQDLLVWGHAMYFETKACLHGPGMTLPWALSSHRGACCRRDCCAVTKLQSQTACVTSTCCLTR